MCHSLEISISLQRHIFQFSMFSTLLFRKRVPMVKVYLPKRDLSIILPILRSTPALEVGIPVSLANFCFFTRMSHMTSGLGGLAPFFRRFLPLLNGYTPFFQPYFGHFWPPVNGFLPSPSEWDCSDFTTFLSRIYLGNPNIECLDDDVSQ